MPILDNEVGSLSRTSESVTLEWKIENILSYSVEDDYLESPVFSGFDSEWCLRLCLFSEECTDSVKWIALQLHRKVSYDDWEDQFDVDPKNIKFSFSLKKANGTFEKVCSNANYVFDGDGNDAADEVKVLERLELERRKSEFPPFGGLTVICTLMNNDCLESVSKLITLSKNFEDLLYSKKECDITLKVQDEEFSVHKSVLASRCPVFETMFNINMKENNTGVVDIEDCTPEAFGDFLKYIYSGKFTNSSSEVYQLYKIAHKYMIQELKSDCVFYMTRNLSVENVLDTAILAHQFDESGLKAKVQEFFNKHFSDIAACSKWDSFLKDSRALSNELLKNMADYLKTSG